MTTKFRLNIYKIDPNNSSVTDGELRAFHRYLLGQRGRGTVSAAFFEDAMAKWFSQHGGKTVTGCDAGRMVDLGLISLVDRGRRVFVNEPKKQEATTEAKKENSITDK